MAKTKQCCNSDISNNSGFKYNMLEKLGTGLCRNNEILT